MLHGTLRSATHTKTPFHGTVGTAFICVALVACQEQSERGCGLISLLYLFDDGRVSCTARSRDLPLIRRVHYPGRDLEFAGLRESRCRFDFDSGRE